MATEEEINDILDAFLERQEDATGIQQELNAEMKATASSFTDMDETTDSVNESQRAYLQTSEEVNDVVAGYSKGLKGLAAATAKMVKSFTSSGESLESLREFIAPIEGIIETTFGALGSVISAVSSGLGNVAGMLPLVGDMLSGLMDGLGDLAKGLFDKLGKAVGAVAGMLAEAMIGALEEALSMFKGATSAGLLFTDGMKGMAGQMSDLMLFQDEYVQVVQKNSKALTLVGGTVADGMNKITKSVKLFDTTFMTAGVSMREELYNMGIGYQEMTEGTVEYAAQLARTGNLQGLTAEQLALQTGEYLKNLKVISALTGKSADEMKKERDEALGNLAFRNKLSKMSADQQKEIMTAMSRVPEEGQKAFKEAIVFGKVMTDVGAITTGMAGHYEGLAAELLSGTSNAKDAISGFLGGIKADLPRLEKAFQGLDAVGQAALVGAGNSITDAINDSVAGQIQLAAQAGEFTQAKFDAAWTAGAGEGALGLQDFFADLRNVYGEITALLVDNADILIDAATAVSGFVSSVIEDFTREWATGDFDFMDFVTTQIKKLFPDSGGESLLGGIANDALDALGIATFWESMKKDYIDPVVTLFTDSLQTFNSFIADLRNQWWFTESAATKDANAAEIIQQNNPLSAQNLAAKEEELRNTVPQNETEAALKSQHEIQLLQNKITSLEMDMLNAKATGSTRADEYSGDGAFTGETRPDEMKRLMKDLISAVKKVDTNTAAVI